MVTHLVANEGFKASEVVYLSGILTDLCEVAQKRGASDAIKRIVDAYDLKGPKAKLPPKESLPALSPNINLFYSGIVAGKDICWVINCVAESLNPAFSGKRFTRTFKDHEVIIPPDDQETGEKPTLGVDLNASVRSVEHEDAVNPLKLLAEGLKLCTSWVSSLCDDAESKPKDLGCCKHLSGLTRENVANITSCVYEFAADNAHSSYHDCVVSLINSIDSWNPNFIPVNCRQEVPQEVSMRDPESLIAYFANICGVDASCVHRLPSLLRDTLGDKQKHFSPISPHKSGYWTTRSDIIATLSDTEAMLPKLGGEGSLLRTKEAQKLLTNSREIYEYLSVTCIDALKELVDA